MYKLQVCQIKKLRMEVEDVISSDNSIHHNLRKCVRKFMREDLMLLQYEMKEVGAKDEAV